MLKLQKIFFEPSAFCDLSHHIVCFANGDFDLQGLQNDRLLHVKKIIAVDGGLAACHQLGIAPQEVIGDFDSVDPLLLEQYRHIPIKVLPKDKDETDLESALSIVDFNKDIVTILGGLGGRTDHLLYHLSLLYRQPGKIFLESRNEWIFAATQSFEFSTKVGQTVSFFPLFGQAILSTNGLFWELKESVLNGQFLSQSNRATGKNVIVEVLDGIVACIIQS